MNDTMPTDSSKSPHLAQLIEQAELFPTLGIGSESQGIGLTNMTVVLARLTQYAVEHELAPSEQWPLWNNQLEELRQYLVRYPEIYPLKAPTEFAGNPYGGDLTRFPMEGVLCQEQAKTISTPLAILIKTAVIYHLVRGPALITKGRLTELRRSLSGEKHAKVLEVLSTLMSKGSSTVKSWEIRALAMSLHEKFTDKEMRGFIRWISELMSIEIEHRSEYITWPVKTHYPQDVDELSADPVDLLRGRETTAIEDEAEPQWLLQARFESDLDKDADVHEFQAELEAQVRQSRYWITSVEQHSAYAWNALNPIERQYLVKSLTLLVNDQNGSLNKRVAGTIIILSLVTGRDIEEVLSFKYGPTGDITPAGQYQRVIERPENSYKPPDDIISKVHQSGDNFSISLPQIVGTALSVLGICNSIEMDSLLPVVLKVEREVIIEACNQLLAGYRAETGYRLSRNKIRAALRQQLALDGASKHVIYLLTAGPSDIPPIESYYVAPTHQQIERIYREAVNALLSL